MECRSKCILLSNLSLRHKYPQAWGYEKYEKSSAWHPFTHTYLPVYVGSVNSPLSLCVYLPVGAVFTRCRCCTVDLQSAAPAPQRLGLIYVPAPANHKSPWRAIILGPRYADHPGGFWNMRLCCGPFFWVSVHLSLVLWDCSALFDIFSTFYKSIYCLLSAAT